MTKKPILLRDLIKRLVQSETGEIYVEVEESEPDVFVLPLEAVIALSKIGGTFGLEYDIAAPIPTFPGGTLVTSARKFLNDGSNAGNHTTLIEPVAGSPMLIHRAAVRNGDTAARVAEIQIRTRGGFTARTLQSNATLGANAYIIWPAANYAISYESLIDHTRTLFFHIDAIAVSQDSYHFFQYSYFGPDAPVVTETGPTNVAYSDEA